MKLITRPVVIEDMIFNNIIWHTACFQIGDQGRYRSPGTEEQAIADVAGSIYNSLCCIPTGFGDNIWDIIILLRLQDQIKSSGACRFKLSGLT